MSFEWLPFKLPYTFTLDGPQVPGVSSEAVRISRETNLELSLYTEGDYVPTEDLEPIPGTKQTDLLLKLSGDSGSIIGYQEIGSQGFSKEDRRHSQITGRVHQVECFFGTGECNSITEWVANTPSRIWPRSTRRSLSSRKRDSGDFQYGTTPDVKGPSFSRDHLQLELGLPTLNRVLVGTVPQNLVSEGVTIDGPGFIQYHRGTDGMPDEGLRNTVKRALEFLFGCGLGLLGHTEFDSQGRILRATYTSSYVAGGNGGELPPALLHDRYQDGFDEVLVSNVVRNYITIAEACNLNHAVWLYLHGRGAPLEMASGFVGAAFEAIRRGFYNLPKNEPRSRLLPIEKWRQLAGELRSILDRFSQLDEWEEHATDLNNLGKRLVDLNKVSGRKLNSLFLQDLNLKSGPTEERAFQARNNDAHAITFSPSEAFERLRSYRAAHTLFARALLSILGAPVHYFDYSAKGFPLRRLADQQGD